MSANAPAFDPLNPTPEERADMLAGFLSADGSEPKPDITTAAFDHGWRMRRNDMAGVVDDDQRELARRVAASWPKEVGAANRIAHAESAIARFRQQQAGGVP